MLKQIRIRSNFGQVLIIFNMKNFKEAVSLLPKDLRNELLSVSEETMAKISEVRLRAGRSASFIIDGAVMYLCAGGRMSSIYPSTGVVLGAQRLEETVTALCRYSVHSFTECINRGYVTLPGGHRAGICGTASVKDGEITAVRCFTSINIRIARDFYGCCKGVLSKLEGCHSFLIIGPPMSGKTTLLRDLCRWFSDEINCPKKLAVIDERDEIAALAAGAQGRNLGVNTDVLSLYPKGTGIEIALRCFSPDIIVLDEIGGLSEAGKILEGVNSGVDFIATAHGSCLEEAVSRPQIKLLLTSGAFRKVVILGGRENPGTVKEVFDSENLF